MTESTPGGQVHRVLATDELICLYTAIDDATTTAAVITTVVTGLYTLLLDASGHSLEHPGDPIDATTFAIPAAQWHAIAGAAIDRAQAWGTAAHVGLELANLLPSSYDDPDLPAPLRNRTDHRPEYYDLRLSRSAVEVIAACETHIAALAAHYGPDSRFTTDSERSWHHALAGLLGAGVGTPRHITADGPLSLYISGPAFDYGVIFHGARRRCLSDGCHCLLTDDGSAHPAFPDAPLLEHRHAPSYPFDAPQPGTWSLHS